MAAGQEGAAGFVEMLFDIEHVCVADLDGHVEEVDCLRIQIEAESRIVWLSSLDDPAMDMNPALLLAGNDIQCLIDPIFIRQLDDEFQTW
ncbi:hypothetical protein [Rhizobium sp. BK602]|uniref:hypothetical protein n=1 Tax=Rhizobium sp. BK602 TaxID=2586986 RepID=UPI001619BF7A|nr:hypothetical protein [Rhizobium sp. BK602]